VRGNIEHGFAFMQAFAHQRELIGFQIAQAAMNEFGGGRRGGTGIILRFSQHDAETPADSIAGNSSAIDATTDNKNIDGVRVLV